MAAAEESEGEAGGPEAEQEGTALTDGTGTLTVRSGEYLSADALYGLSSSLRFEAAALGRDGETIEETKLYFFVDREIPTLYLDTASGSMEAVNADKSHKEKGSFLFLREDGSRDASGTCVLHGRGNSSWKEGKKQYSLNLADSAGILGMDASRKFALIANHSDSSDLRNKTVFDLARLCGMPASPQSVFVNVYFNGTYNGLYLLAQRPNAKGGSVEVADLEAENEKAARQDPGSTVAVPDPEGLEIHAFGRRAVPDNITGGYLLEIDGRCEDEDCWFSTRHHHFVIKYPEEIPLQEAEYIAGYVREAEEAVYAEDGKNPDTGRSWEEYLDSDSWAKIYLMQDFMAQWDAESFSFFIYKDADDPLLYCGPVWDFDLSMGTTGLGRLPNPMQRSMWLEDHRPGWLTELYSHPAFSAAVRKSYSETFAPALEAYLDAAQAEPEGAAASIPGDIAENAGAAAKDGDLPAADGTPSASAADRYAAWMDRLRASAAMDAYRWKEQDGFSEGAAALRAWLRGRLDFYADHEEFPEEYCQVTFQYAFAEMKVYVRRGTAIGFVPTEEYGEHFYKNFRQEYGNVDGWTAEDGSILTAETLIDHDQVFLPFEEQE